MEITPILGLNHNYSYVLPEKYLALERGDGSRFLQETSFINATTPTYSPPTPPIDCESFEYQCQYKLVNLKVKRINRNVILISFFGLVLLAAILSLGIFCLMVDLKIPFAIQFNEGNPSGSGSENEVVLGVQPDLPLSLVVHSKTTTSSAPEVTIDGIAEDSGKQIWNLSPWLRD